MIASLANEDVSFAKVAELIEKDTVLAGNILKLVNSALYGLAGTVNSIRHAVSLLGIAKLRNAALSMSVARMWNQVKTPPGWSTSNFNQHSVGVGILADLLAQRLNVQYAEGAFAAGLFHDLGLMLIAIGLHDEYKQLTLLSQANHDYDGHRVKAMKSIHKAAVLLKVNLQAKGDVHENQGSSDEQLQKAQKILKQARTFAAGRKQKKMVQHIDAALGHLSAALATK